MIFVTVGSDSSFDRLVRAVDAWAGQRGRSDVFAQVGNSRFVPQNVEWEPFLSPRRFREVLHSARLVVAHAGIGSILTALELGKPILVLPRSAERRETRNEHQLATARRFAALGYVRVAEDEVDLERALDELADKAPKSPPLAGQPEALIGAIRKFVEGGRHPAPEAAGATDPGNETGGPTPKTAGPDEAVAPDEGDRTVESRAP